ncbi:MAG: arginine deiminase family protein [Candidatus Fermentibacteria bacterium]
MKIALMKEVSSNISDCEISTITRTPIDHDIAMEQHRNYADTVRKLGYKIHMIKADELPDSVFIEDTAVVLDEIAVITNPGASSRRAETQAVAEALHIYRDLKYINPTGTLDGGDVLQIGRVLYVGKSCRSSAVGISQLREILKPFGYEVKSVPVQGCLHLKSAVSLVSENTLLLNPSWVSPDRFDEIGSFITVDPSEPYGANALFLDNGTVYSTEYPATRRKLISKGINVVSLEISELAKAEGEMTCCSIIFDF